MDLIPLIYMENRKIYLEKETTDALSAEDFLKQVEEGKQIYVLDLDGIKKDKPNLCNYQKLSSSYNLWIDNGPRDLGDVVDAFMAGATDITLRKNLGKIIEINDIREITENKIYVNIDFVKQPLSAVEELYYHAADGLVTFNSKDKIEADLKYADLLKTMKSKNRIYSYETTLLNQKYWEAKGVEGILIDLNQLKEPKTDEF